MNKEISKAKAKALITFLKEKGIKLNHSGALEAIARIDGKNSYNVLCTQTQHKQQPIASAVVIKPVDTTTKNWTVNVVRTGFSETRIEMTSLMRLEDAKELAFDLAGDRSMSEKQSEYTIPDEDVEFGGKEYEDETSKSKDNIIALWSINVRRESYGSLDIVIEAETLEEAHDKALDNAGNEYFECDESRYVITDFYRN